MDSADDKVRPLMLSASTLRCEVLYSITVSTSREYQLMIQLWHLKLPSFVAVEPSPYDPDTHRDVTAAAEKEANEQNDKKVATANFLLAKNTIRWKWVNGPDGQPVRYFVLLPCWSGLCHMAIVYRSGEAYFGRMDNCGVISMRTPRLGVDRTQ